MQAGGERRAAEWEKGTAATAGRVEEEGDALSAGVSIAGEERVGRHSS